MTIFTYNITVPISFLSCLRAIYFLISYFQRNDRPKSINFKFNEFLLKNKKF